MSGTTRRLLIAAVALAALLVSFGCSTAPTSPGSESGQGPSPSSLTTDATDDASPPSPAVMPTGVSTTREINGLLGGTVRAGNFSVVFPPAAFVGKAMVTVRQADVTKLVVDLDISPATKNHFLAPVLLVADCKDKVPPTLLSTAFISWWNPATSTWDRVSGSSVSVLNLTVQAPLWHFSSYRVDGKAGW